MTGIGYVALVRVGPAITLSLFVLAVACGGASKHTDPTAGGEAAAAAGMCAEPDSAVPALAPFQVPPDPTRPDFQVTFHNQCAHKVWPAYGSAGGLDNSVIDTQLWLPLSPMSERSVAIYGGVRELGFWGRTRCSFDQAGGGACETGECGGFVCPITVNQFPRSATIFVLDQGFLGGYNVALRVAGATCGDHRCAVDARSCSDASVVKDSCGSTIACDDLCTDSTAPCCSRPGSGCSATGPSDGNSADDLDITFCP